jgi:hypothetical protein
VETKNIRNQWNVHTQEKWPLSRAFQALQEEYNERIKRLLTKKMLMLCVKAFSQNERGTAFARGRSRVDRCQLVKKDFGWD